MNQKMTRKIILSVVAVLIAVSSAWAKTEIPEPLQPWTGWVLKGREAQLCPFFQGGTGTLCRWASPLALSIEDTKGAFSVHLRNFEEGWIALPGDADHWPQDVKASGSPLTVVEREGRPQIYVEKGSYAVTGSFLWETPPESLAIPREIGVVRLSLRGSPATKINRDDDGRLWLEAKPVQEDSRDQMTVRVHRLLTDDIPFTMTTRITLEVSGKTRDATLPSPLSEGFIAMALESPLPAQVEKDGGIKVQVKAGTWNLEFKARHQGPVKEILASGAEPEIWAFEAHNDLRLVNVTGVSAIDPTQTTLPDEWKSYPAYRLNPGERIVFEEQRRGDSDTSPDQISLVRDLWLDFDGRGYTARDTITGTLAKGSRLDIAAPLKLGHVTVNGPEGPQDQLITTLDEGKSGVELREGRLNLSAESRLDKASRKIPATGWEHDFQDVSETLHLPPGWRALAVLGADSVPDTWLNRWTLLEIFLVVIAALSFAKLWGWQWGALAFAGLGLTATEDGAPLWVWIAVLVGVGLLRFLPEGKFKKAVSLYRLASLLVLVVLAVPFLVDQVRSGLYPSLENPGYYPTTYNFGIAGSGSMAPQAEPMPPPPPPAPREQADALYLASSPKMEMKRMLKKKGNYEISQQALSEYQPGAKVQTGPGLPGWRWRSVQIRWSGPVEPGETIRLVLIPPLVNLILSFARVLLVALLVLRVVQSPVAARPRFLGGLFGSKPVAAILTLIVLCAPFMARAEFPSPDLLQELQNRLLEKPACYPNCASISRMRLEATPASLTTRMEIHVEAASAVPLPGGAKEWSPTEVTVDGGRGEPSVRPNAPGANTRFTPTPGEPIPSSPGRTALTRTDDGRLWIALEPGVHQVLMTGPLPDRQNVQVPLPLKPRYVEVKADGWSFLGLHEDGLADDNLQLVRSQTTAETSPTSKSDAGNALPAFLTVERRLVLGLTWEVETRVVRETPVGTAVVVQVPLLTGESVTTPGIRVESGKVPVSLSPQATEVSWRSTLLESSTIPLKAEDSTWWTEVWIVEAGPIWHVKMEGLPVVHHYDDDNIWRPMFRPWPGEEATLQVFRPNAVEGQTLTLDQSRLTLEPGGRSTEATLWLSLRSSLGQQHTVTLPHGAELQSVAINGQTQPIGQVGDAVTLPVVPGAQTIELKWHEPRGIGTLFKAPVVALGVPSVNAEVKIQLPERWTLWVSGPRLGPAVLFWGLVVVLLLVALALGRVPLTPLKMHHWFLLGLGLTQVPIWSSIFVALWLLALGWRKEKPLEGRFVFDLRQLFIAGLTVAALVVLVFSIERGLLGIPVMQIEGNGSSDSFLIWFQDRIQTTLPRPWVVTLPLYVYRIAMLAWAVWLALALLKWLKWGWECFGVGGLWKDLRRPKIG